MIPSRALTVGTKVAVPEMIALQIDFLFQCEVDTDFTYTALMRRLRGSDLSIKYDVILFDTFEWKRDILSTIRDIRAFDYTGGLIITSASKHSLRDLALSYPLAKIVDVVLGLPFEIEHLQFVVNEALNRSDERRRAATEERDALWDAPIELPSSANIGFTSSMRWKGVDNG